MAAARRGLVRKRSSGKGGTLPVLREGSVRASPALSPRWPSPRGSRSGGTGDPAPVIPRSPGHRPPPQPPHARGSFLGASIPGYGRSPAPGAAGPADVITAAGDVSGGGPGVGGGGGGSRPRAPPGEGAGRGRRNYDSHNAARPRPTAGSQWERGERSGNAHVAAALANGRRRRP